MYKKIKITYFSGTGGTTRVAKGLATSLAENGSSVELLPIRSNLIIQPGEQDLLVLVFAVHAFNASDAVYRWVKKLAPALHTAAAVISVSGGGEVASNSACRASCIRKLERKGYTVTYEDMAIMPSNWMYQTVEPLALKLLEVLPRKTSEMAARILSGEPKRTKPQLSGRILSRLGEAEKFGAQLFGRHIKVNAACNGCAWCARGCPAENITMHEDKPIFNKTCNMCMRCIYGCPQNALRPGFLKSSFIKGGFSIEALEQKLAADNPIELDKILDADDWSSLMKYIS